MYNLSCQNLYRRIRSTRGFCISLSAAKAWAGPMVATGQQTAGRELGSDVRKQQGLQGQVIRDGGHFRETVNSGLWHRSSSTTTNVDVTSNDGRSKSGRRVPGYERWVVTMPQVHW